MSMKNKIRHFLRWLIIDDVPLRKKRYKEPKISERLNFGSLRRNTFVEDTFVTRILAVVATGPRWKKG